MYLPAIVMVGYYFDKRRALATGVAVCGSGIGTFLFAPVTNYLLKHFGWRGAMWITSSLVLHGTIFGAFYRPLRPVKNRTPQVVATDGLAVDKVAEIRSDHNNMLNRLKSDNSPVRSPSRRHRSLDITGTGTSFLPHARINSANDKRSKIVRLAKSQDVIPTEVLMRWSPKPVTPFYRKDVLYTGSVLHLAQKMRSPSMNEFISSMVDVPGDSLDGEGANRSLWGKTCLAAKKYIDFSLFLRPTFVIYCLSCVLHMLGKSFYLFIYLFIFLFFLSLLIPLFIFFCLFSLFLYSFSFFIYLFIYLFFFFFPLSLSFFLSFFLSFPYATTGLIPSLWRPHVQL